MNISIIRGAFLNKLEKQSHKPLIKYYILMAHCTNDHFYNIKLPS